MEKNHWLQRRVNKTVHVYDSVPFSEIFPEAERLVTYHAEAKYMADMFGIPVERLITAVNNGAL